jgi:FdhD protein
MNLRRSVQGEIKSGAAGAAPSRSRACASAGSRCIDKRLRFTLFLITAIIVTTALHREVEIERSGDAGIAVCHDRVAVEEPLEIRVSHLLFDLNERTISITMRTPGNDDELALGYLYAEGIISDCEQVGAVQHCAENVQALRVELLGPKPDLGPLQRVGTLNSSCGVCGKTSVKSLAPSHPVAGSGRMAEAVLRQLPQRLRAAQPAFAATGGLHGVGLFDLQGNLLAVREDVGRHNALDKLIGWALKCDQLPWTDRLVLLSGRASYELLQKSAMAGASMVAAVGAPSSLAIEQAHAAGITLIGFLNERGYNVYAGRERLVRAG